MKNKKVIIIIGIALLTGFFPPVAENKALAQTSVSFQLFYDQLSPFGTWVNYPDYGYVWVPGAGNGFRPYATRGHWIYTEDGWVWVSDYSWGWATFHYGNWFYDDDYGWMWVPGYQWAPAWVTWGEYQGNYCWAPVGPRVDISVSFGSYRPPYRYWNFCPRQHITSTQISNYYVTNIRNTTVVNNITVINNVNRGGGGRGGYLRGPAPTNVERFTHSAVRPVAIRPASRPGAATVQGGQLAIYRPTVQNNASARPAAIRDLHSLRPANGSHPGNRPGPASSPSAGRPNQPRSGAPATTAPQPANRPSPAHLPARERPLQPQPANPQPHPVQPAHPGSNPRPMQPAQPQPHTDQPRSRPAQPHPAQPRPMQQPQQRPMQPQPHPAQPQRPMQQPHPAMPHPVQQPRPARPVQPPPHEKPQQQPSQDRHR